MLILHKIRDFHEGMGKSLGIPIMSFDLIWEPPILISNRFNQVNWHLALDLPRAEKVL